jgi:hypothetical protein
MNASAAFAIAAMAYWGGGMQSYAKKLEESAVKVWDWALANPNMILRLLHHPFGTFYTHQTNVRNIYCRSVFRDPTEDVEDSFLNEKYACNFY